MYVAAPVFANFAPARLDGARAELNFSIHASRAMIPYAGDAMIAVRDVSR